MPHIQITFRINIQNFVSLTHIPEKVNNLSRSGTMNIFSVFTGIKEVITNK